MNLQSLRDDHDLGYGPEAMRLEILRSRDRGHVSRESGRLSGQTSRSLGSPPQLYGTYNCGCCRVCFMTRLNMVSCMHIKICTILVVFYQFVPYLSQVFLAIFQQLNCGFVVLGITHFELSIPNALLIGI
ncbi:hypothetical protein QCA50_019570 [Cerrena zonata]|uniref:Uncharacterized protein n=1 Tax=Cerrena zonata TaxID=2478898 RepID=A0AAW0FJR6_9APHY